jgi:hypothetical protein
MNLVLALFVVLGVIANASRILDEQLAIYEKILREGFNKQSVDVEGFLRLMHLQDGHPK